MSHLPADLTLRRAELPAALRRPDQRDSDAIPRVGVTLAAVERFQREVARARGAQRPWLLGFGATTRGLTTDAVNKFAMAHLMGGLRCAYVSLLDAGNASLVGEATVFVSHAWAMPFDALVAALRESEREQRAREPARTPYFWLDVLVNDQFAAPARPSEWWQTEFRENVRRIGHTLVVLEWERPLPLQRLWCIWEIFCAASAVAEAKETEARAGGAARDPAAVPQRALLLELALPPASRAAFERALTSYFPSVLAERFDLLVSKLCCIDLHDADAFHGGSGVGSCSRIPGGCPAVKAYKPCPNDKAQILGAIERAPGGVDGVTKVVNGALREWMVGSVRKTLAAEPDADKRARIVLQMSLADFMYEHCGRPAEAEALLRESADAWRRTYGAEAAITLTVIGKLATVLQGQGKLGEAEQLMRETLAAERRTLGDAHFSTLTSISNLGMLLKARGDLDGAENLLREDLAACRRTLGDAHLCTLTSMNNLGSLLQARGDLDSAEKLYREALAAARRSVGTEYQALESARDLADVLVSLGDTASVAEAALLADEMLAGLRRNFYWEGHSMPLIALRVRGRVLAAQGDLAGAAAVLRASFDGLRATGKDDYEARKSARELAAVLRAQGDEVGAAAVEASVA